MAGAVANNMQHAEVAPQPQHHPQQQQQQQPQNNVMEAGADMAAPNVVMNAGAGGIGAMEDDDEVGGGQRDVLDWCYVATRVLVLFSVVYFYSSLARFALAAGLGIVFYLYNNNFFGQNNNNNNNNQNLQRQQQEAAINEVGQVAGANVNAILDDNNPEELVPTENHVPEQPHFLNVMATFVTTFFTSLLPHDPQVV